MKATRAMLATETHHPSRLLDLDGGGSYSFVKDGEVFCLIERVDQ